MGTLTLVEAQRIMTILGEGHEKLSSLSYITDDVMATTGAIREYSEEVGDILTELQSMEGEYLSVLKDGNFAAIEDVGARYRQIVRTLCRALRENPTLLETLQTVKEDRSYPQIAFAGTYSDLKGQVYLKLSTNAIEEKTNRTYLSEMANKEKKATNDVRTLQKELKTVKNERNRAVHVRKDQIQKLMDELSDIRQMTQTEEKNIKTDTETRMTSDKQTFDENNEVLHAELEKLKVRLKELKSNHKEEEEVLRRKRNKLEQEVENWIQKYDQDMDERTTELETIQKAYGEEKVSLAEYEEHFEKVEKERREIEAEERRKAEIAAKEEAAKKCLDNAATKIQAWWKGLLCRRELSKTMKKKGKKGKKGGKKKKK